MTIKRIHVDQHVIRRNHQTGSRDPAITIQTSHGPSKAHAVEIMGPSKVVYSPDKPLKCGARVWIETHAPICVDYLPGIAAGEEG